MLSVLVQHRSFKSLAALVERLSPNSQQVHFGLGKPSMQVTSTRAELRQQQAVFALGRWLSAKLGTYNFGGYILHHGNQPVGLIAECVRVHILWWTLDRSKTQLHSCSGDSIPSWHELCSEDLGLSDISAIILVEVARLSTLSVRPKICQPWVDINASRQ